MRFHPDPPLMIDPGSKRSPDPTLYVACSSMAEHPPVKRKDVGSSPTVPAIINDTEDAQSAALPGQLFSGD